MFRRKNKRKKIQKPDTAFLLYNTRYISCYSIIFKYSKVNISKLVVSLLDEYTFLDIHENYIHMPFVSLSVDLNFIFFSYSELVKLLILFLLFVFCIRDVLAAF